MYPGVCYAMLALLSGLNVLAKFASQPRSLASGRLVLGVKHLILNVERIRGSALKPYINIPDIEFPEEKDIFIEIIKQKLNNREEITHEEVEMLKCQSSRTKGLVEDWTALFEPFKHNFYKHFNLENLGKKLTKLFATDEAPGRSISKELVDLRQREKNTLYPWEKKGT